MQKVIIVASQRVGSSFLIDSLDKHPKISMFPELLKPGGDHPLGLKAFALQDGLNAYLYRFYLSMSRTNRLRLPMLNFWVNKKIVPSYLDSFFRTHNGNAIEVLGFKLMVRQMNEFWAVKKWLRREKPKLILLRRDNLIKKHVSMLLLLKRKRLNLDPATKITTSVDLKRLAQAIDELKKQYVCFDRLKNEFESIEFEYSSFFADLELAGQTLMEFLGLPLNGNQWSTRKKVSSDRLQESVDNYEELERWACQNGYGHFLS